MKGWSFGKRAIRSSVNVSSGRASESRKICSIVWVLTVTPRILVSIPPAGNTYNEAWWVLIPSVQEIITGYISCVRWLYNDNSYWIDQQGQMCCTRCWVWEDPTRREPKHMKEDRASNIFLPKHSSAWLRTFFQKIETILSQYYQWWYLLRII